MKAEDFEARLGAARDEAETLAAVISAASVDERSGYMLKLAMRRRMIEEVSKITGCLEKKAREEEAKTVEFPVLDGRKEVWIYFFQLDTGETIYDATLVEKESATFVTKQMRKKHRGQIWHMRYKSFLKAIEGLKQDILDGRYDESPETGSAKLIFNALRDKAL